MEFFKYFLRALPVVGLISLGLSWWKIIGTRSEPRFKAALAAACVTLSDIWFLVVFLRPGSLPPDDSRFFWPVVAGNAVAMGLVASVAIFRKGPGKALLAIASVLSMFLWASIGAFTLLLVV
jgi:hypothetical protein